MILGGSTLKGELVHRRLLGLKSRKMCSKAADNMSSNEALHHFTTTSGNFGWLQGDIFCQTDVLLSLGNDTYMTAALNPLSLLWKANNLQWRIFYLIKQNYYFLISRFLVLSCETIDSWKSGYLENCFRPMFHIVFDRSSSRILRENCCCYFKFNESQQKTKWRL